MQTPSPYSIRKSELEFENLQELSKQLLGSPIVIDEEYEVENKDDPVAYRTEDYAFMFVPQLDDPVMGGRTLTGQKIIPGKYRYSVEIGVSSGGSYWEPPDYDQVEIAREDSLMRCIGAAAHYILDQKINGIAEGLYWDMESKLEKEFPDPLRE